MLLSNGFTCFQVIAPEPPEYALRDLGTYTHAHMGTYTHAHMGTYTYAHMYTPMRKHTSAHTHAQTDTHTHTHIHTHTGQALPPSYALAQLARVVASTRVVASRVVASTRLQVFMHKLPFKSLKVLHMLAWQTILAPN
jgi:hypothetical protein